MSKPRLHFYPITLDTVVIHAMNFIAVMLVVALTIGSVFRHFTGFGAPKPEVIYIYTNQASEEVFQHQNQRDHQPLIHFPISKSTRMNFLTGILLLGV